MGERAVSVVGRLCVRVAVVASVLPAGTNSVREEGSKRRDDFAQREHRKEGSGDLHDRPPGL